MSLGAGTIGDVFAAEERGNVNDITVAVPKPFSSPRQYRPCFCNVSASIIQETDGTKLTLTLPSLVQVCDWSITGKTCPKI
jgi:hypothetical protein